MAHELHSTNALTAYRSELSSCATLTPDVERALAARFRAGDRAAGDKLIAACLPFVMTIAFEYRRWGLPIEDIVQEGNIGLLKAAERFDPERGCRLATYAAYWIRAEIREFVVRGYRIVRLGTSKSERRALRLYRKTREGDAAALAEQSGLTVERAAALLPLLSARDVSLDATTPSGGSAAEALPATQPSPEDDAVESSDRARLSAALATAVAELSPREQRIVAERWLTESPRTLEQLGTAFGVSKERVRQLEERAKSRLKARMQEITGEKALPLAS